MQEKNKILQPAIKWTGSKRSQANEILKYFPKEIDTYYEPFCGGCSVLGALMLSDIKVKHYICSDLNNDLISLWNEIKEEPIRISEDYKTLWNELVSRNDIKSKSDFYNTVRDSFNKDKKPWKFIFLLRTCANGLVRYNRSNKFNTPFHLTRNGINPYTLSKIICEWSELLNKNDVKFLCCDYSDIKSSENDFLYLDPPYYKTKGIYQQGMDFTRFWEYLRSQPCNFVFSFDGKSGNEDNTFDVPKDIYGEHIYIKSGKSSFKRILGNDKNATVYESLYIKKTDYQTET
jgi:DNA adenine methylase